MDRISLNGIWKFSLNNEEYDDAVVPGSLLNDLINTNKIENPYFRTNEEKTREFLKNDCYYTRDFFLDEKVINSKKIYLYFEGLDTIADIYLNGVIIGFTKNMHRTYRFNITKYVKAGLNNIKVVFLSPTKYIEKKDNEYHLWGMKECNRGFAYLRKSHCSFGWDFGPNLPDMGIIRDVYILYGENIFVEDVQITQKHLDSKVIIEVNCINNSNIENYNELIHCVKFYSPSGDLLMKLNSKVDKKVKTLLNVENPVYWWPAGLDQENVLKKQPLYKVVVEILHNDDIYFQKEYLIGLRTFKIKNDVDSIGVGFNVMINGKSIFIKGVNYIPEDSIQGMCSYEKTKKLILDCVKSNINLIRVWGGGNYPQRYLYELCDEYGILVWQDFMFGCAIYELSDEFEENIKEEIIEVVKKYRNYTSLLLWCGNNEIETAIMNWEIDVNTKNKIDYLNQFETIIPEIIEKYDKGRFYWPSSPSCGGGFESTNDYNNGDSHYWDVWHGMKSFAELKTEKIRFCSEFGFQSFPSIKTIRNFTNENDLNPFSYIMDFHQKNKSGTAKIMFYIAKYFRYPRDFISLIMTTQILQAEYLKLAVEFWRSNKEMCKGAIIWQLNDCWPGITWSTIDYFGRWKVAQYYAKRFFAPVLLICEIESNSSVLYISNESKKEFIGKIMWSIRDNELNIITQGEIDVKVTAFKSKIIEKIDVSNYFSEISDKKSQYIEFKLLDEKSNLISSGNKIFIKTKYFNFIKPEYEISIEENDEKYVINIKSEVYTKCVEVKIDGFDINFNSNYLDIVDENGIFVEVLKADISSMSINELRSAMRIKSLRELYV